MRNHLIHLHTSGETKPIGLLKLGEIAIRHISNNISDCRIYIDTATDTASSSEDTIAEFVPKSYLDEQINFLLKFVVHPELVNYYCFDSGATPVIVNDGYVFDSGVTEITPCTYDLRNMTILDNFYGAAILPSSLTSITANMESLQNALDSSSSSYNIFRETKLMNADLYLPNLLDGGYMFYFCNDLISFNGYMPNMTDGDYMFASQSLTDFSADLSSLTNGDGMFYLCNNLTNVTLYSKLNCNRLSFSSSSKLTVDSLMNIINALVDRTGQDGYTLRLGSTNLAKLSPEQKAIATNKNWTLS